MPMLPSLEVTDAQAKYLLGIFGDVATYRAWLLTSLKSKVMEAEMSKARADAQAYLEQKRIDLEARLSGIS